MKNTSLWVLAVVLLSTLSGCSASKSAQSNSVSAFNAESVRVLVEGRDRGATPMTLHVSRTRGEYDVQLRRGQQVVRVFEIGHGGRTHSPEQHALNMDLEDDRGAGFRTYGLDDLETENDTLFFIPYTPETIAIDDKQYGLTLLISN